MLKCNTPAYQTQDPQQPRCAQFLRPFVPQFSIEQVQQAFREIRGKAVDRHKACALLRILEQDLRLIERVGGYVPGVRGRVWRVEPCG